MLACIASLITLSYCRHHTYSGWSGYSWIFIDRLQTPILHALLRLHQCLLQGDGFLFTLIYVHILQGMLILVPSEKGFYFFLLSLPEVIHLYLTDSSSFTSQHAGLRTQQNPQKSDSHPHVHPVLNHASFTVCTLSTCCLFSLILASSHPHFLLWV